MRPILLALALTAVLHAQDPGKDPDDAARDAQSITAGKAQFAQTCGFCHGPDGRGASGPDLIRSALVSHDVTGELIGPVIHNGRPEKGMPAFQLSDAEIRNVAAFLHNEASGAASVAKRIPTEYPLEKLLVGNAQQGSAFFTAHCASCHSATGDLEHIATKYKPFDLQTRLVYPAGIKPTITVKDHKGQTYTGEQVYADEFVITLRDANRWLHTFARKTARIEVSDPLAAHQKLLETYSDQNVHDVFAYLETLK